jgi:hypothetical protein
LARALAKVLALALEKVRASALATAVELRPKKAWALPAAE